MGSARKIRRKYVTPRRPYDHERFETELPLMGEYGLRNKKELFKTRTKLRRYRQRARALRGLEEESHARKTEEKLLIDKLVKIGIMSPQNGYMDVILSFKVEVFLERRLQTQVFRRGLASTIHQARQLIVHGHIAIKDRRITTPSYHLVQGEEEFITFAPGSILRNDEHPLRKEMLAMLSASGTVETSEKSSE